MLVPAAQKNLTLKYKRLSIAMGANSANNVKASSSLETYVKSFIFNT